MNLFFSPLLLEFDGFSIRKTPRLKKQKYTVNKIQESSLENTDLFGHQHEKYIFLGKKLALKDLVFFWQFLVMFGIY